MVYFDHQSEYTICAIKNKSARSYDNERRRLENILGDYMQSRQTDNKKNVFLSIDSRTIIHNPLYKVWKMKTFYQSCLNI